MDQLTGAESELAEAVEHAAGALNALIMIATGRGMCVSLRVIGGTQSNGSGFYEVGRGLEDCREEGAALMHLRALAFRVGLAGPS